MNTGDLEARVLKLEKELASLSHLNLQLVNREVVLRGMMHSLLNHLPDDQKQALHRTYGQYLTLILEQIPPDVQDREILEEFEDILSHRS
ncbi:hypothetical protein KEHDKFFH_02400 [Marinobacter maroccanus]|uniref:Uncharacterized protein n=1 Tax=Marinobacter maroccanus TaxID=2055143 RepID=A0A2S5ZFJ7_9GAMM|nr:hypothetical protein [Marinobacter maroccanus]PPI86190.1 hypothetical protein KEHDKFFH_02400 [Marinobacter maroccanus]